MLPANPFQNRAINLAAAVFRPPPDFEPLTSLIVAVDEQPPNIVLTFQHDYPADEFAPAAGWKVDVRGAEYTVTAADGRKLTCGQGGEP